MDAVKNHNSDLAIADFGEAIRLKPDYLMAYFNRGQVYDAKGNDDKAIADYNEVIRLKPDNVAALNNLAWILAVPRLPTGVDRPARFQFVKLA